MMFLLWNVPSLSFLFVAIFLISKIKHPFMRIAKYTVLNKPKAKQTCFYFLQREAPEQSNFTVLTPWSQSVTLKLKSTHLCGWDCCEKGRGSDRIGISSSPQLAFIKMLYYFITSMLWANKGYLFKWKKAQKWQKNNYMFSRNQEKYSFLRK